MPKTRILLADDDQDHQRLLTAALRQAQADIDLCVVSNREELLDALSKERFDGVVLDFNLARVDAPQVLEDAEALLAGTPVVVISSLSEQSVVIESLRTGVADFVPKERAIEGDILWTRVDSAIRAARREKVDRRKLQRRLETLNRAANHDPLTGLSNRRHAVQLLNSERNRKDRRQVSSLVLLDLDHFKRINDDYGHAAGDTVLVRIADLLRRRSAPSDAAIRWGGEEFLVIKGSASLEAAWLWAERILQELRQIEFHFARASVRLTASIGIATLESRSVCEDSIQLADRALYLAKDLGRDRVCTSEMANVYAAAMNLQCRSVALGRPLATDLLRCVSPLGPTQMEHVGAHSALVRDLAVRLGRLLSLGAEDLERLRQAAMLHDVGKLAVPEALLAKPGALTIEERRLVETHSRFGAEICSALGLGDSVAAAVGNHHRRFDSHESTAELKMDAALLPGIINVADAFVAMTSDRPYASKRSKSEAFAELHRERGLQFDPQVVDTFIQASSACASG